MREERLLLLQRLAFLRDRGLARRVGSVTFELSAELRPALRRDVQKRIARAGIVLGDPDAEMRFTRLEACTHVFGRFVWVTRREEESQGHWMVEGIEGPVHAAPESAALGDWRSREASRPGDVVSLRGGTRCARRGERADPDPAAPPRPSRRDRSGATGVTVLDLEA